MNRILSSIAILLIALSLPIVGKGAYAADTKLAIDTAVRYGKLDNGLTYYIRHNSEPKNRADFYIAQNVGSILEEDNQRGLAHFLEHMAFNGTTHFPGKSMLEYLQDKGISFGRDINAYTSFDNTVYYISNVNTQNSALMDSTLLAIYDWGNEISLLDEEIEKERGVINEEWRTRGDAQMRMFEKVIPIMYAGSQYANRLPIGTMDVVMNFKPQTIRDYYEKWYRPDQQGIIVVGDFDAAVMEKKVKKLFSNSKMPQKVAERKIYPVLDNDEPIYALYTDPETSASMISLFFKHDITPKEELNTVKGYRNILLNVLVQTMFADRFNEITQKADAPFNYAMAYDGDYFIAPTKDAFSVMAFAKDGKFLETFNSITTEAQRAAKHGFTDGELQRAKAKIISLYEQQYNERNKRKNEKLAQEYVSHFTENDPIPGIETEYVLTKELVPEISLNDVNNFISSKITPKNAVILISAPEKVGLKYPTETEIVSTFKSILSSDPAPYKDSATDKPLLSKMPKAGKIISEKKIADIGVTELILSNGAKVLLKPTDFKNDEISMSAISYGGKWSTYNGKNASDLKALEDVINISALGEFKRPDLRKQLAGKNVTVNFVFGEPTENISANSSKKDLETMLQLNYLYFTDVRKDNDTFEALKSRLRSQLAMRKNNPLSFISDTIQNKLYQGSPLYSSISNEDVDAINYDNILAEYQKKMNNAGDFTFSFVGNFDIDSIKPMIAQYISSLPDNKIREAVKYTAPFPAGVIRSEFTVPMVNPKTTSFTLISGKLPYSLKNDFMFDMLNSIMRIVYTNTIREEEGGTYGVGTSTSLSKYTGQWSFSYNFDTNIEAQQRLNERALKELKKVMTEGANDEEFRKAKEAAIMQYDTNLRNNDYWMSVLRYRGIGMDIYTGYEKIIKSITLPEFNEFMKKVYNDNNNITVIMNGAKPE